MREGSAVGASTVVGRGFRLNVISYSGTISACEQGGPLQLEADVISYRAAISACENRLARRDQLQRRGQCL